MSAFANRRKARVITAHNDEDGDGDGDASPQEPSVRFASKSSRKPFRQSNVRKPAAAVDAEESISDTSRAAAGGSSRAGLGASVKDSTDGGGDDEDDAGDGPVVVRPSAGRTGSHRKKKVVVSAEDAATTTTKKVPLSQRVLENSAFRKSLAMRKLPTYDGDGDGDYDDDDNTAGRPHDNTYSKEYLDELHRSTPNTPQNMANLPPQEDESMVFDSSELAGALIMNPDELGLSSAAQSPPPPPPPPPKTTILTDAEIRERKGRRARLATEADYVPFDDDESDSKRKKKDSRLVRDDEELGEGFDSFVEDGGISLGKTAARAARRQKRREMEDMIMEAEGGGDSDDSSDASEAERRAAYEAAQARAGMDGLKRDKKAAGGPARSLAGDAAAAAAAAAQAPPRITPLPGLASSLARLRDRINAVRLKEAAASARVAELERERAEIVAREQDVQQKLNEAGEKYRAAAAGVAGLSIEGGGDAMAVDEEGEERPRGGLGFGGRRGLESFGMPGGEEG